MKIYLVLYNISKKYKFIKYFESEFEKDKFKRKLKYSTKILLIEDSTDIIYG